MSMLRLDPKIIKKIKLYAVKNDMTMGEVVMKALKQMGVICFLMVMVSCSSGKLVPTDKTNYARFEHKQKIEPGMTQREVMEMFGSPDVVTEDYNIGKGTINWHFYHKIFCNHRSDRCLVVFNNRGRVMYEVNFRMEFSRSLVDVE